MTTYEKRLALIQDAKNDIAKAMNIFREETEIISDYNEQRAYCINIGDYTTKEIRSGNGYITLEKAMEYLSDAARTLAEAEKRLEYIKHAPDSDIDFEYEMLEKFDPIAYLMREAQRV